MGKSKQSGVDHGASGTVNRERQAAKRTGLRYVCDSSAGIADKRWGDRFGMSAR